MTGRRRVVKIRRLTKQETNDASSTVVNVNVTELQSGFLNDVYNFFPNR